MSNLGMSVNDHYLFFSSPPSTPTHTDTMSWDVCYGCISVIWNAVLCVIGIGTVDLLGIELYDTHILKFKRS